ncbi:ABC transporter substrate-binding protein [Curvibacter sp. APW13]|uniref:ABC transporter substrate-binding protein n=1 Tax=Curvibacter sp. APW13 TaxID=3077236 RepID=UPI0028E070E9|nr:ABC transporter substrate-binding protein [Curvibacter sp. APW13]MDT8990700.1 ABC transporter substrate-binding protein [Curvibacter sp. APW13]
MSGKNSGALLKRRTVINIAGASMLVGCSPPLPPVRVGTIVFPGYELVFLARAMGWLSPDLVRLIELQNSSDSVRALAAGKLEAALLTLDEMMSARAGGVDLRAVLVLDTSDGADQVLARPGVSLSSLAGRKIAAENNSVGALVMASLLEKAGLRADQVVKVPITQARAAEVYQKGLADVVVTAEPWAGQIKAKGGRTIFDSSAFPDRIVDVLAVRADVLTTHHDALQHLVDMQLKALNLLHERPAEAAIHVAPRLQLEPAQVAAAFDGLKLPDAAQNRAMLQPDGTLAKNLPLLQSILLGAKLLSKPVDTATLLDDRFVRAGGST